MPPLKDGNLQVFRVAQVWRYKSLKVKRRCEIHLNSNANAVFLLYEKHIKLTALNWSQNAKVIITFYRLCDSNDVDHLVFFVWVSFVLASHTPRLNIFFEDKSQGASKSLTTTLSSSSRDNFPIVIEIKSFQSVSGEKSEISFRWTGIGNLLKIFKVLPWVTKTKVSINRGRKKKKQIMSGKIVSFLFFFPEIVSSRFRALWKLFKLRLALFKNRTKRFHRLGHAPEKAKSPSKYKSWYW